MSDKDKGTQTPAPAATSAPKNPQQNSSRLLIRASDLRHLEPYRRKIFAFSKFEKHEFIQLWTLLRNSDEIKLLKSKDAATDKKNKNVVNVMRVDFEAIMKHFEAFMKQFNLIENPSDKIKAQSEEIKALIERLKKQQDPNAHEVAIHIDDILDIRQSLIDLGTPRALELSEKVEIKYLADDHFKKITLDRTQIITLTEKLDKLGKQDLIPQKLSEKLKEDDLEEQPEFEYKNFFEQFFYQGERITQTDLVIKTIDKYNRLAKESKCFVFAENIKKLKAERNALARQYNAARKKNEDFADEQLRITEAGQAARDAKDRADVAKIEQFKPGAPGVSGSNVASSVASDDVEPVITDLDAFAEYKLPKLKKIKMVTDTLVKSQKALKQIKDAIANIDRLIELLEKFVSIGQMSNEQLESMINDVKVEIANQQEAALNVLKDPIPAFAHGEGSDAEKAIVKQLEAIRSKIQSSMNLLNSLEELRQKINDALDQPSADEHSSSGFFVDRDDAHPGAMAYRGADIDALSRAAAALEPDEKSAEHIAGPRAEFFIGGVIQDNRIFTNNHRYNLVLDVFRTVLNLVASVVIALPAVAAKLAGGKNVYDSLWGETETDIFRRQHNTFTSRLEYQKNFSQQAIAQDKFDILISGKERVDTNKYSLAKEYIEKHGNYKIYYMEGREYQDFRTYALEVEDELYKKRADLKKSALTSDGKEVREIEANLHWLHNTVRDMDDSVDNIQEAVDLLYAVNAANRKNPNRSSESDYLKQFDFEKKYRESLDASAKEAQDEQKEKEKKGLIQSDDAAVLIDDNSTPLLPTELAKAFADPSKQVENLLFLAKLKEEVNSEMPWFGLTKERAEKIEACQQLLSKINRLEKMVLDSVQLDKNQSAFKYIEEKSNPFAKKLREGFTEKQLGKNPPYLPKDEKHPIDRILELNRNSAFLRAFIWQYLKWNQENFKYTDAQLLILKAAIEKSTDDYELTDKDLETIENAFKKPEFKDQNSAFIGDFHQKLIASDQPNAAIRYKFGGNNVHDYVVEAAKKPGYVEMLTDFNTQLNQKRGMYNPTEHKKLFPGVIDRILGAEGSGFRKAFISNYVCYLLDNNKAGKHKGGLEALRAVLASAQIGKLNDEKLRPIKDAFNDPALRDANKKFIETFKGDLEKNSTSYKWGSSNLVYAEGDPRQKIAYNELLQQCEDNLKPNDKTLSELLSLQEKSITGDFGILFNILIHGAANDNNINQLCRYIESAIASEEAKGNNKSANTIEAYEILKKIITGEYNCKVNDNNKRFIDTPDGQKLKELFPKYRFQENGCSIDSIITDYTLFHLRRSVLNVQLMKTSHKIDDYCQKVENNQDSQVDNHKNNQKKLTTLLQSLSPEAHSKGNIGTRYRQLTLTAHNYIDKCFEKERMFDYSKNNKDNSNVQVEGVRFGEGPVVPFTYKDLTLQKFNASLDEDTTAAIYNTVSEYVARFDGTHSNYALVMLIVGDNNQVANWIAKRAASLFSASEIKLEDADLLHQFLESKAFQNNALAVKKFNDVIGEYIHKPEFEWNRKTAAIIEKYANIDNRQAYRAKRIRMLLKAGVDYRYERPRGLNDRAYQNQSSKIADRNNPRPYDLNPGEEDLYVSDEVREFCDEIEKDRLGGTEAFNADGKKELANWFDDHLEDNSDFRDYNEKWSYTTQFFATKYGNARTKERVALNKLEWLLNANHNLDTSFNNEIKLEQSKKYIQYLVKNTKERTTYYVWDNNNKKIPIQLSPEVAYKGKLIYQVNPTTSFMTGCDRADELFLSRIKIMEKAYQDNAVAERSSEEEYDDLFASNDDKTGQWTENDEVLFVSFADTLTLQRLRYTRVRELLEFKSEQQAQNYIGLVDRSKREMFGHNNIKEIMVTKNVAQQKLLDDDLSILTPEEKYALKQDFTGVDLESLFAIYDTPYSKEECKKQNIEYKPWMPHVEMLIEKWGTEDRKVSYRLKKLEELLNNNTPQEAEAYLRNLKDTKAKHLHGNLRDLFDISPAFSRFEREDIKSLQSLLSAEFSKRDRDPVFSKIQQFDAANNKNYMWSYFSQAEIAKIESALTKLATLEALRLAKTLYSDTTYLVQLDNLLTKYSTTEASWNVNVDMLVREYGTNQIAQNYNRKRLREIILGGHHRGEHDLRDKKQLEEIERGAISEPLYVYDEEKVNFALDSKNKQIALSNDRIRDLYGDSKEDIAEVKAILREFVDGLTEKSKALKEKDGETLIDKVENESAYHVVEILLTQLSSSLWNYSLALKEFTSDEVNRLLILLKGSNLPELVKKIKDSGNNFKTLSFTTEEIEAIKSALGVDNNAYDSSKLSSQETKALMVLVKNEMQEPLKNKLESSASFTAQEMASIHGLVRKQHEADRKAFASKLYHDQLLEDWNKLKINNYKINEVLIVEKNVVTKILSDDLDTAVEIYKEFKDTTGLIQKQIKATANVANTDIKRNEIADVQKKAYAIERRVESVIREYESYRIEQGEVLNELKAASVPFSIAKAGNLNSLKDVLSRVANVDSIYSSSALRDLLMHINLEVNKKQANVQELENVEADALNIIKGYFEHLQSRVKTVLIDLSEVKVKNIQDVLAVKNNETDSDKLQVLFNVSETLIKEFLPVEQDQEVYLQWKKDFQSLQNAINSNKLFGLGEPHQNQLNQLLEKLSVLRSESKKGGIEFKQALLNMFVELTNKEHEKHAGEVRKLQSNTEKHRYATKYFHNLKEMRLKNFARQLGEHDEVAFVEGRINKLHSDFVHKLNFNQNVKDSVAAFLNKANLDNIKNSYNKVIGLLNCLEKIDDPKASIPTIALTLADINCLSTELSFSSKNRLVKKINAVIEKLKNNKSSESTAVTRGLTLAIVNPLMGIKVDPATSTFIDDKAIGKGIQDIYSAVGTLKANVIARAENLARFNAYMDSEERVGEFTNARQFKKELSEKIDHYNDKWFAFSGLTAQEAKNLLIFINTHLKNLYFDITQQPEYKKMVLSKTQLEIIKQVLISKRPTTLPDNIETKFLTDENTRVKKIIFDQIEPEHVDQKIEEIRIKKMKKLTEQFNVDVINKFKKAEGTFSSEDLDSAFHVILALSDALHNIRVQATTKDDKAESKDSENIESFVASLKESLPQSAAVGNSSSVIEQNPLLAEVRDSFVAILEAGSSKVGEIGVARYHAYLSIMAKLKSNNGIINEKEVEDFHAKPEQPSGKVALAAMKVDVDVYVGNYIQTILDNIHTAPGFYESYLKVVNLYNFATETQKFHIDFWKAVEGGAVESCNLLAELNEIPEIYLQCSMLSNCSVDQLNELKILLKDKGGSGFDKIQTASVDNYQNIIFTREEALSIKKSLGGRTHQAIMLSANLVLVNESKILTDVFKNDSGVFDKAKLNSTETTLEEKLKLINHIKSYYQYCKISGLVDKIKRERALANSSTPSSPKSPSTAKIAAVTSQSQKEDFEMAYDAILKTEQDILSKLNKDILDAEAEVRKAEKDKIVAEKALEEQREVVNSADLIIEHLKKELESVEIELAKAEGEATSSTSAQSPAQKSTAGGASFGITMAAAAISGASRMPGSTGDAVEPNAKLSELRDKAKRAKDNLTKANNDKTELEMQLLTNEGFNIHAKQVLIDQAQANVKAAEARLTAAAKLTTAAVRATTSRTPVDTPIGSPYSSTKNMVQWNSPSSSSSSSNSSQGNNKDNKQPGTPETRTNVKKS